MHYSGILVVALPGRLDDCIRDTEASGVAEVHHREPASHRFIAVVESATLDGQTDGLRRLKALPDVLMAELVYYHHDVETGNTPPCEDL